MQESNTGRYFYKKQQQRLQKLRENRENTDHISSDDDSLDELSASFIQPLDENDVQPTVPASQKQPERTQIHADRIAEIKRQLQQLPEQQLIRAGVYPIRMPEQELRWLREERKQLSRVPWVQRKEKIELDERIRVLHAALEQNQSPQAPSVVMKPEPTLESAPLAHANKTVLQRLRDSKVATAAASILAAVGLMGTALKYEKSVDAMEAVDSTRIEQTEADEIQDIVMQPNYVFDRAAHIPDPTDSITLKTTEGTQELERSEAQRSANNLLSSALQEGAAFAYTGMAESCAVLDEEGQPVIDEEDGRLIMNAQLVDVVYGDQLAQFSGYQKYDRLLTFASGMNTEERTFVRQVLHGSIVHFPSIALSNGPSVRKAIWEGQKRIPTQYQDQKALFYRNQLDGAIRFSLLIYHSLDGERLSRQERQQIQSQLRNFIRSQVELGVLWQVVGSEAAHRDNKYARAALMEGTKDTMTGESYKPHIQELRELEQQMLEQLEAFTLLAHTYQLEAVADDTARMEYKKRREFLQQMFDVESDNHTFWQAEMEETKKGLQALRAVRSENTNDRNRPV